MKNYVKTHNILTAMEYIEKGYKIKDIINIKTKTNNSSIPVYIFENFR